MPLSAAFAITTDELLALTDTTDLIRLVKEKLPLS